MLDFVATCSVPSREMRAGQALAAIPGPTASGQTATTSAIGAGGAQSSQLATDALAERFEPSHAASATLAPPSRLTSTTRAGSGATSGRAATLVALTRV